MHKEQPMHSPEPPHLLKKVRRIGVKRVTAPCRCLH